MAQMHTCAANDCEAQITTGRLLCRAHWYDLPQQMRRAINQTWRDRRRNGLGAWSANVLEARAYLAGGQEAAR